MDEPRPTEPQTLPGRFRRTTADEETGGGSHSIPIPNSGPRTAAGWHFGTPPSNTYTSRVSDTDGSGLSRSLAFGGGSFIAGHSAFSRQACSSSQPSRHSLEAMSPAMIRQPSGGPFLGLEPGLGLTTPLLDQHKHDRSMTSLSHALDVNGAPGTPSSVAASEAARTIDRGSLRVTAEEDLEESAAAAAEAGATVAASVSGKQQKTASRRADVVYGIINAIVGIPTMVSFAAIVWKDPLYKPLLGQLARVSFFSAAVHQLMFTLWSSLPFAVGQPQDVGLIFLSAMATSIAEIGQEVGLKDAEVVGTAMLTLTVATFVVGIMTWLVAKFKLATLVQYVPLPVVGGYLGYVGYFCLAAGVGLGTNTSIDTFSSWAHLGTTDALIKFVPTIAAALVLWVCMTRAESPWALPITLAAIPAAFHVYLLASGTTLAQAQDAGWVLKPQGKSTQQFWELYELFNIQDWRLDGIYLPGLVRQIPKMLGLFFVVTFGSCLDVAAIQADMPFPIDFNGELATVGLSNMIVGLSGSGYTGSYIFSQTIFSMRAGVSSYAHGTIIAALEAAIFLLPFSVVQYLPNFFFGALLTVFGIEIAGDWLVRSYAKVTQAEYVLLLATFVSIMELELEMGVAAGILLCTIYFAVTYARANMSAVTVLPTRSAAVRSYLESHVLEALSGRTATVALSGFMFFGSSVLMSDKVIALAQDMMQAEPSPQTIREDHTQGSKSCARQGLEATDVDSSSATGDGVHTSLSDLRLPSLAVVGKPQDAYGGSKLGLDTQHLALIEKQAPAFIILDFRRVLGVDATSAQTLSSLAMVLRRMGVELIFSRVNKPSIHRLLVAHGIISASDSGGSASSGAGGAATSSSAGLSAAGADEEQQLLLAEDEEEQGGGFCRAFDTLNGAAKYAEDRLLAMAEAAGLLQASLTGLSLGQFFAMHCKEALLTSQGVDVQRITQEVAKLGVERQLPKGQRLFSFGEVPDCFYLILKGVVSIHVKSLTNPQHSSRPLPAQLDVTEVERSFSSGQGAVVGITDFVLKRLRSFQADATSDCTVLEISRAALDVMVGEVPEVATAFQAILLRDACLSEVYAYEVLERAAAA